MSAVKRIEQVLKSGVLIDALMVVPETGASDGMLVSEENKLSRSLSGQHKILLKQWNGINLDIIRLYGCEPVEEEVSALSQRQQSDLLDQGGYIVFGDDPAGYMYVEANDGSVISVDSEGGEIRKLAKDIDDFFMRLVFGVDAKSFAGEAWEKELSDAGLL